MKCEKKSVVPIVVATIVVLTLITIFLFFIFRKSDDKICRSVVRDMFEKIDEKEKNILEDTLNDFGISNTIVNKIGSESIINAYNTALSYKICDVRVEGDRANVYVDITNAEAVDSINSICEGVMDSEKGSISQILADVFSGSKLTIAKRIVNGLKKNRNDADKHIYKGIVYLKKKNGNWKVQSVNNEVVCGYLGVNNINNIVSEYLNDIVQKIEG